MSDKEIQKYIKQVRKEGNEIIKNDLKQKVDRSEFEALVRRVSFVEKRVIK